MSQITFVDAKREESRLRLAIMGPAGAGKTYSLLLTLYGIIGDWSKIFVIDTERGSAALYEHLCGNGPRFKVFRMEPPYSPARYREAIRAAESAGALGIIVDSLSHAWDGDGGALDRVDAGASRTGNSYTAWKDVTPDHRAMVDAILQSPAHIACAMRSKQEYVLEPNEKGKMVPRRVGLAPVQRAGMEFEFTMFLDVDDSHFATATKDRTGLLDGKRFKPSIETGQVLRKWLEGGAIPAVIVPVTASAPQAQPQPAAAPQMPSMSEAIKAISALSNKIKAATKRSEGAALWSEVEAAAGIIGAEAAVSLKNDLKMKAKTLSAE